jgi:hypothetical protein
MVFASGIFGAGRSANTATAASTTAAPATAHGSLDARERAAGAAAVTPVDGGVRFRKLEARVADVAQALARILAQAFLQELAYARWCVGGQRAPIRVALQDARDQIRNRLTLEHRPSGKTLVKHATERPDVGATIDHTAPRLLGTHVCRRAENDPGARGLMGHRGRMREIGVGPGGAGAARGGEPEVENFHLPRRGDDDIAGFEVAVHDAVFVRGFHSRGDVAADVDGLVDGKRPARESLRQRFTVDELEHEIASLVHFLDAVDGRDVGVRERCQHTRLALEAREPLYVLRKFIGECLDGDVATQARVAGAIHLSHSTRSEGREDFIGTEACAGGESHVRRVAEITVRSALCKWLTDALFTLPLLTISGPP